MVASSIHNRRVMGDRLWADKPAQYFMKAVRPTQPPTPSGTGSESQPKWSDVLWPGSEGRLIPLRMDAKALEMVCS